MTRTQAMNFIRSYNKKNEGDKPAELYEGYSGRGMFGETTFGVVVENRPAKTKFRIDNMGLDWIVY